MHARILAPAVLSCLLLALAGCGGSSSSPAPVVTPTPAPTITTLSVTSGATGSSVTITGTRFTGATAVKFNGTAATFAIVSDTSITTSVPASATSGTVTVTTPGGTATSAQSFTVSNATTRSFWVQQVSASSGFTQASFTLAHQNARCNVWLRSEDAGTISNDLLTAYGEYFATNSWANNTTYVHQPTEFFNDPGRINLLFYNMYTEPGSGGFIAGYFYPVDFYLQADLNAAGYGQYKSNETNVLYINIYGAVNNANQARATQNTNGTLTHELQHLCNTQYFFFDATGSNKRREMDTWANELCSITMEAVFAGQFNAYYLPIYLSSSNNGGFRNGSVDFLQWRNDWQQYVANAMLGTHLLARIPANNRPNLFKALLANTEVEGITSTTTLTSVEDLQAALQSPALGGTPSGWTTVPNFVTGTTSVRDNWSILLAGLGKSLTGQDATYNTYLATLTSLTMRPACVSSTGGSFALRPSGLVIGATYTNDLGAQTVTAATSTSAGNTPAYVVAYNGSIPSHAVLDSSSAVIPSATVTFGATQLVAPPAGLMSLRAETTPLERGILGISSPRMPRALTAATPAFMIQQSAAAATDRPFIPGIGNPSNGGSDSAGYNYCFFVGR